MRCLLITIGLLAFPHGAFALTWDFADDTTWGWAAQESFLGDDHRNSTTVYSEVEDGVWRIAPVPGGQLPAIQLRSPPIGEDSALFDYVTLRLRIIHDRPTGGNLLMQWFNAEYRHLREELGPTEPSYQGKFTIGRYQIYPTEWENITVDLRALEAAGEANPQEEIIWQDTLFNFQLELNLNINPQGPADHPVFVEVDWIQLTGAEELLLGELPPREIAVEEGLPGGLFAAPSFFPLVEGIGMTAFRRPQHAWGDVDGDGDVDLVLIWVRHRGGVETGWLVASNDGLGGFAPTQEVSLFKTGGGSYPNPVLAGGDFDGDGLLDLAVQVGGPVELWKNRGEDGFEPILQLSDVAFVGLADGDGDSDLDLLGVEVGDTWSNVIMWFNDGAFDFVRSDRFVLDSEENLFALLLAGQPLGEAVRLLWVRPCYLPQGTLQLTQPWATSKNPPLFLETVVNPCDLHLLTDLDGDGAVELIGPPDRDLQFEFLGGTTYHGLALWRVDASGVLVRHTLLGSQVLVPHRAIASDLNGDGLLDLAVVDGNLATGPALVVLTGQRDGVPVVEGRYRLPGVGGQVLAGDVNGDGATDLVVLGRSVEGGPGGAFVFLNQGISAPTAVAGEMAATPSTFALGANYPNPFNPATTIPVTVSAEAGDVDLTIYNVLGQPVRQVWTGPLAAGEHRLTWDGRDAQGQPVAAGVYVYRLQVGEQTRIRKMVKLE